MEVKDKTVAIIGLGLIGGSFAWCLKSCGGVKNIIGTDADPLVIEKAQARGIIDWGTTDIGSAAGTADIIILSTPVQAIVRLGKDIIPHLKKGCVVTDVGSCKTTIVNELDDQIPEGVYFVGGHPMAGSECSGIDAAHPDLFKGSFWALTPTPKTNPIALDTMVHLTTLVGAIPVHIDPKVHDTAVAYASHLPYLVAVATALTAKEGNSQNPFVALLSASGFRDTTRVASSDTRMSFDFIWENRQPVIEASKLFAQTFQEITYLLQSQDSSLLDLLNEAKNYRDNLLNEKGW